MAQPSLKAKLKNRVPVWTPWAVAAAMTTAMFVCIAIFGDMHYANNDDSCILRPLMGFSSATLPTFHLYLNALLVYPLNWLGTAFPGIAWFSYLQLAFLWVACTVIVKSILRIFINRDQPIWLGVAASAVYLLAFGMTYSCVVTFTVTAGLLGAAAVMQILSVDCSAADDGKIIRGMAGALVLVVLGYSLRQVTVLPVLAFCAIAFLYQGASRFGFGKAKKRSWKPLIISAVLVVAVVGTLAGLRELEINGKGMGDYLRWQKARISVVDYAGLQGLPDELLAKIGWSREELELVDDWYFLDSNISAEAFETIAAYQNEKNNSGLSARISNGVQQVKAFFTNEPLVTRSLWLLAGVGLLCAVSLLMIRKGTLWKWLALAATLLLGGALFLYLGMLGRLPQRAALMAALPASALVFGLLPECLPARWTMPRKIVLAVLACGCLALTAWYAVPAAAALAPRPENDLDESTLTDAFADLDEYALDNPDLLFIFDDTLVADKRMFPNTENGIPTNVMFWGGWGARSPGYTEQLAAFGFDADNLDATIFLDENVRLARGQIDPPPNSLINYLTVLYGDNFDYTFDDEWGGLHTLQFYTLE
ncbi:MAG: hypothetical protein PHY64_04715 [Eubacteriales bacterium]|nr:hypothetical protein [Eubacteriales bacterium]